MRISDLLSEIGDTLMAGQAIDFVNLTESVIMIQLALSFIMNLATGVLVSFVGLIIVMETIYVSSPLAQTGVDKFMLKGDGKNRVATLMFRDAQKAVEQSATTGLDKSAVQCYIVLKIKVLLKLGIIIGLMYVCSNVVLRLLRDLVLIILNSI